MVKIPQPSAPVINVVLGQNATHEPTRGPRYHELTYNITVTKTAATAGFTSAAVTDALERLLVLVNDNEVREVLTSELDQIHVRWSPNLAIVAFDNLQNDLITAAPDVIDGANTSRTTTFVVTIYFSEPSRSTFGDREKFAWPTRWASGRTAKLLVKLTLPDNDGISDPVITAQEVTDDIFGGVINGKDVMPVTAWKRMEEQYSGKSLTIRKWPFTGILQQFSIFSPEGDDVETLKIKSGKTVLLDAPKAAIDRLLDRSGWNPADDAKSADRCDYAFDFSDNPGDGQPIDDKTLFEVKIDLIAADAAVKTQVLIVQVYQDLLNPNV